MDTVQVEHYEVEVQSTEDEKGDTDEDDDRDDSEEEETSCDEWSIEDESDVSDVATENEKSENGTSAIDDPWKDLPPPCPLCEMVSGDMTQCDGILADALEFSKLCEGVKLNWLRGALERYREVYFDLEFTDDEFIRHFVDDHNKCKSNLDIIEDNGRTYLCIINNNIIKMRTSRTDPNARIPKVSQKGLQAFTAVVKAICTVESLKNKARTEDEQPTRKKKKF